MFSFVPGLQLHVRGIGELLGVVQVYWRGSQTLQGVPSTSGVLQTGVNANLGGSSRSQTGIGTSLMGYRLCVTPIVPKTSHWYGYQSNQLLVVFNTHSSQNLTVSNRYGYQSNRLSVVCNTHSSQNLTGSSRSQTGMGISLMGYWLCLTSIVPKTSEGHHTLKQVWVPV